MVYKEQFHAGSSKKCKTKNCIETIFFFLCRSHFDSMISVVFVGIVILLAEHSVPSSADGRSLSYPNVDYGIANASFCASLPILMCVCITSHSTVVHSALCDTTYKCSIWNSPNMCSVRSYYIRHFCKGSICKLTAAGFLCLAFVIKQPLQ